MRLDVLSQNERAGVGFISTYFISIPSFVKQIEIAFLVISFALSIQFKDGSKRIIKSNWQIQQFHLLICVLGVVGCIIVYTAYCFNVIKLLQKRFQSIFFVLTLLHIIGVIFLLISTSLIMHDCKNIQNYKIVYLNEVIQTCHEIGKLKSTSCSVYEGSAATGFLALIVLVFDTYLHCRKYLEIKIQLALAKEEEEEKKRKLAESIDKTF